MPYFYIYKVTLPQTGEYYIGSRKSRNKPEDDVNYKGSMTKWKVDKQNLIKEILDSSFDDMESLILAESNEIKKHIENPLNRNYHIPSTGFFNKGHSEETRQKLSNSLKGKSKSAEHKENLSKSHIGKSRKPFSEETIIKMSESKKGEKNPMHNREFSEEHREKLSKSRIGKSHTEETKEKMKASSKHKSPWNKGKTLSEETKMKMSESAKNRKQNELGAQS